MVKKMKKAVITILGLIGHQKKEQEIEAGKIKDIYKNIPKEEQAFYSIDNDAIDIKIKGKNYLNMLNLISSEDFFTDYDIIAIGTEKAINIQKKVLEYENLEDREIKYISITDENDYTKLFKKINNLVADSAYNEVIFDVSHGFRHLPILATVSLIIQNIKNPDKIKHILFAKEIESYREYQVIDLQEYLDLANLSFILTNFKKNYTTAKHIIIKNKKYKPLLESMNDFSSHLMALSLETLLTTSTKNLIDAIDKLLQDDNQILKKELEDLKEHIESVFKKHSHRYVTYYKLAIDLFHKGYIAQALSLLYEGIGFYAKTSFAKYSNELNNTIKQFEMKIKNKQPIHDKNPDKIADYYTLTSACRSYILFPQEKSNNKKANNDKLLSSYKKQIYSQLNNIENFSKYCEKLGDTRNNLLHSNSSEKIKDIKELMEEIINNYKKYCIEEDILKFQKKSLNYQPKRTGLKIVKKAKEKPNVKQS